MSHTLILVQLITCISQAKNNVIGTYIANNIYKEYLLIYKLATLLPALKNTLTALLEYLDLTALLEYIDLLNRYSRGSSWAVAPPPLWAALLMGAQW